jgi:hypothetical protein
VRSSLHGVKSRRRRELIRHARSSRHGTVERLPRFRNWIHVFAVLCCLHVGRTRNHVPYRHPQPSSERRGLRRSAPSRRSQRSRLGRPRLGRFNDQQPAHRVLEGLQQRGRRVIEMERVSRLVLSAPAPVKCLIEPQTKQEN